MRPRERRDSGQNNLFKAQLQQIVGLAHPLVKLARTIEKRGVDAAIRRQRRRRAAAEPVIGHLKKDHRMDRNHLAGRDGDAVNAVLAAVGYNFKRLLAWLRFFWLWLATAHLPPAGEASASADNFVFDPW